MALAGGLRTIFKNVAEVSATATAVDFGAHHKERTVDGGLYRIFEGGVEAGPAGAAVEFGFGGIQR